MKTSVSKTLLMIAVSLLLAAQALAADPVPGHKMDGKTMGKMIHESKVENFSFAYHLLDNEAGMASGAAKDMKMDHSKMEGMKSHHLMLYPLSPDKKVVKGATAGFLVIDPSGTKSQAMAKEMDGGYGAEVEMKAKGAYTIKTKLVVSGKVLVDEFSLQIK